MSYFAKNLKYLREKKGVSRSKLSEKINVNQSTISRWENEEMGATVDNALDVANFFHTSIADLVGKDLTLNNTETLNIFNTVKIPIFRTIKTGIKIEEQDDVFEYVDIPAKWTIGNKFFYGFRIKDDSMEPKYQKNDIVIFEYVNSNTSANKKDCAIMISDSNITFKNVTITTDGITLIPLNLNNSDNYAPTFYTKDLVSSLPVKIIGVAVEKRTRL